MVKIKHKVALTVGGIVVFLIAAVLGGYTYYRSTHFNKNIQINGVSVGGLNEKSALAQLKSEKIDNNVYLNGKLLLEGKKTSSGFTQKDLSKIRQLLKKQWTFLPESKKISYQITPSNVSNYRTNVIKPKLKQLLDKKNSKLTAAVDSHAVLRYGKITYTDSKKGNQYNVAKILTAYDKQKNQPTTNIKKFVIQPVTSSSNQVKKQKEKLETLAKRTVVYKVQQTNYNLAAKDVINQATYIGDKYQISQDGIVNEINDINNKQATLQKSISFKTHAGDTVNVPGGTYGWALKTSDSYETISAAFINNKSEVDAASDIYGVGYLTYGTGYDNLTNDGIGTTYAEISIQDQRAWFYIDGKEVYTTNIVTGKHSTNEDTPTGVWYIMYKQSPATLEGSEAGNANYSVKVNYWAQFTSSGCGFHDASWRTDWSSTAYLTNGSGGCANTPSANMESVYNSLSQKEAVVVY
ncbi:MAG: L,D-transpeptidase [Liquorilactobacillus hordei]|uniref:L,D-transpeptidase n=1 Tax=Liquorilactobacillus hordei TaxID=468911 RepID=UPI0039E9C30C